MLGVGTDIIQIGRIQAVIDRQGDRFAKRILRPEELASYRAHLQPHRLLAKRFAVKEAVGKALGTGIGQGVSWQDILITHNDIGAPAVELSGRALEVARNRGAEGVMISVSDEKEYVVAFAVLAAATKKKTM